MAGATSASRLQAWFSCLAPQRGYSARRNERKRHVSPVAEVEVRAWPIRQTLRAETQESHERLERAALLTELSGGSITLPRYRHYLQRMHAFHAAVDGALMGRLPPAYAVARLNQGTRLASDLHTLGTPTMPVPPPLCRAADALAPSPAAVWGVLYVLEGARLGSQLLLRRNAANAAVCQAHAYIQGEGERTGSFWRDFCVVLEEGATLCDRQAVCDLQALPVAANRTFSLLGDWLEDCP